MPELGTTRRSPPIEDAEAVINVPHRLSAGNLVVGEDAAVAELDVAGVPLALVAEDGHQGQSSSGLEGILEGSTV